MNRSRILIIEDEPLIARDLKRIVEKNEYEVAATCHNSDKALDILAKKAYDLILLDIHLTGTRNGIDLAKMVNEKYFKPFIYITSFADRETIHQVKTTEPAGYIVKPFNEKEIFSAIEIALYKANLIRKERQALSHSQLNHRLSNPLTETEFKIVENIIKGMTNSQMAKANFVSENTIKTHIRSIYKKMNVHSKAELVAWVLSI